MYQASKIVGNDLAIQAVKALRLPEFESEAGYCQRFVRQVFFSLYGQEYPYSNFAGSALETMHNFASTKYARWNNIGSVVPVERVKRMIEPGDYLYKGSATSGSFGHVGIAFNNNTGLSTNGTVSVAENSSYHTNPAHDGNVSGAKGFRTLEEFGSFELLVRLSY